MGRVTQHRGVIFFCFIFYTVPYAPSTLDHDSCRREQTDADSQREKRICGLGFACRMPSLNRWSIAPRSRSRHPCPCPFVGCVCRATPLSLGSCLFIWVRQTAKTASPNENPSKNLHFSWNSFFFSFSFELVPRPGNSMPRKKMQRCKDANPPKKTRPPRHAE